VQLPALPLHFWDLYHFRRIGNILGVFLEADLSFLETHQKQVACILVNINIREGLAETINLDWGPVIIPQILDYENVPFRCRRCHAYGHPVSECSLPVRTYFGGRNKQHPKGRVASPEKGLGSSESLHPSAEDIGREKVSDDPVHSIPEEEAATVAQSV